jgi:hypothetical protein
VYAVTKNGDKSFWTEIGAAWGHQDEKGFNVKLDYLPLNGAEIVIREPRRGRSLSRRVSRQDNTWREFRVGPRPLREVVGRL